MSILEYLVGVLVLAVVLGALAFGATQARTRWLPTWHGAPARLAEITAALTVVIVVPQLLGAVGQFRRGVIVLALVAIGIAVGVIAKRAAPRIVDAPASPQPRSPQSGYARAALIVAGVLTTILVAQWGSHIAASYSEGTLDGDALWYHLPFAANFVQSGYTTKPLFTNADTLVTYFPANSETVSGVTMALLGRDILVPLLNLGWLALALLAAWCIGSRYQASAVAVAALAMVMGTPLVAATQAGTARNDMMGVALLLVAVALVVQARWDPVALGLAGAANGLTLGVKLSTVPMAIFLAIGVLVIAPRARRWKIAIPWLGAFVACGAFWYVRNLIVVGNPLPWVEVKLGPISLPEVYAKPTSGSAVLDRLGESGSYSRVLRPGLEYGLGPAWWLLLLVLVATVVGVIAVGRGRTARMLGVVAGLGLLAYIAMPNGSPEADSAFGSRIFGLNLRYAFVAITLAFVCLVVLPKMDDGRVALAAVVGLAAFEVGQWSRRSDFETHFEWHVTGAQRAVGLVVAAVAAALLIASVVLRHHERTRPAAGVGAALVALGVIVVGFFVADTHLDQRYGTLVADAQSSAGWQWAQPLAPSRIGVFGDLIQYPYVGPKLANRVRYIGVETDGGFRDPATCREWFGAIADGGYEYVVTSIDFVGSNTDQVRQLREWTNSVPGARVVLRADPVVIYQLSQAPDPDACP